MNLENLIQRVDQLIEYGERVLATRRRSDGAYNECVDYGEMKGFRSAVLSFIERVYGPTHSHYKEFNDSVNDYHPIDTEIGIAIIKAIRDEIEGGWLFSLKGLITAEIFADFLEMAEYLLSQDYKDPAAVVVGSVLEEHLRQLCIKNNIEVEFETNGKLKPKKADRLNSELAKAEVYNKLDQKAVTTWLDLRNKAAHGNYDAFTKEQVVNMLNGITEFIRRVSM